MYVILKFRIWFVAIYLPFTPIYVYHSLSHKIQYITVFRTVPGLRNRKHPL